MKPNRESGIETVWVQLPTMSAHEAFSLGKEIAANSRHPLANRIARALGERYFPEGQKAAVAVSLLPIFERRAKSRMADGARGAAGKSSDEVGKLFHISGRYVRAAKRLQSENPKLFQSVLRGWPPTKPIGFVSPLSAPGSRGVGWLVRSSASGSAIRTARSASID